MKKLFLSIIAVVGLSAYATAQDDASGQTAKGKWVVEANTGFGAGNSANTSFSFSSQDNLTQWAIGGEAGHFIADDLAIKLGLGYFDRDVFGSGFTYKVGAKYYVNSIIPIQVDFTGASIKDADDNPSWVGIQGGYAIFLGDMVSIEPGLRYNLTLDDAIADSVLQINVGFALHF
ncbi:hypothetical protein [Spongiivirga citrea]|uniref:Outer membrane beta-barrel protein n=1 Tax=Spongiivirga citrea TaxID=1481457 RepID=A0A6M0CCY9_9FLAO|nr:hypothetical protein [Spongiivirga citrea]NER15698.1 hypothetical protein [Spongiivirga citrea]